MTQNADYVVTYQTPDGSDSGTYRTKLSERAQSFAALARKDGYIVTIETVQIDSSDS